MFNSLGDIYMTAGVESDDRITIDDITSALDRYSACDWGDVPAEDKQANDEALREGYRILASYKSAAGEKFWIITEASRAYTTVLLPSEY